MPDTIVARLVCGVVTEHFLDVEKTNKSGETVTLNAVYDSEPSSPNYSFSQATPWAQFQMSVTNPGAWGFFLPGATYDLSFERAMLPPSDVERA